MNGVSTSAVAFLSRAHVRTRGGGHAEDQRPFGMPAIPRCGALLRNGQPCGRTAEAGSEFCVYHTRLLEEVDPESLRQGRIPKKRALKEPALRVVAEPAVELEPTVTIVNADPTTVRPTLALAAAENLETLTASLLEAAASATKPTWITVECSGCGERTRIEAPVPDVRSRLAAIELLLHEGLGRPAAGEDVRPLSVPTTAAAVRDMSWDDMQALFAATYVDEIATAQREGGHAVVRDKVAALTDGERSALRDALFELEHA